MTFNKNNTRGVQTYETPSVTTLEVLSEGVLCGSFDKDNCTESFNRDAWDEL